MTTLTKTKIEVELIRSAPLSDIIDAWRFSRPAETETDEARVFSTDIPVNEFAQFSFRFYVPIVLREIITSFRNHVVWARSSRVENLDEWPIYHLALSDQHSLLYAELYDKMQREKTEHQDRFRLNIPQAFMTRFACILSLRGLVRLLSFIDDLRAETEDQNPIISELCDEFIRRTINAISANAIYSVARRVERLFDYGAYGSASPLAKLPLPPAFSSRSSGIVTAWLPAQPLAFRAQLVRHRAAIVQDEFANFLTDDALALPISTPLNIICTLTDDDARKLASARNCWIAQEDLWAPLVSTINRLLGLTAFPLPCDGGQCPYPTDNELRRVGKDPSPVCPKYMTLAGETMPTEARESAIKYLAGRTHSRPFWVEQIEMQARKAKEESI